MAVKDDPNRICTFSLRRNPEKQAGDKRPDFILLDSEKKSEKTGKPYRKNFTVFGSWSEAYGYIQEDKTIKITIKKTPQLGGSSAPKNNNADNFLGV